MGLSPFGTIVYLYIKKVIMTHSGMFLSFYGRIIASMYHL